MNIIQSLRNCLLSPWASVACSPAACGEDNPSVTVTAPEPGAGGALTAFSQALSTTLDTPINITSQGNEPDPNSLSFSVTSQPVNGLLTSYLADVSRSMVCMSDNKFRRFLRKLFFSLCLSMTLLSLIGIGHVHAAASFPDRLLSGEILTGDEDIKSTEVRTLIMQLDGNLVLYNGSGHPLWATGTRGPGAWVAMQADGNLVVYSADGRVLWAANTEHHPGSWLALQADGNLVIYAANGHPLWATGTLGGWMEMLGNHIAQKRLTELVIPGTHESATYDLDDERWGNDGNTSKTIFDADRYLNPRVHFEDVWETSWDCGWVVFQWTCDAVQSVVKKPVFTFHAEAIERLAEAQTMTITQQLEKGIRYFDFRTISDGGDLRAIHTLVGNRIFDLINEVRDYLNKHDREIVILDFAKFFQISPPDDDPVPMSHSDHFHLINYLKTTFGNKIVDWSGGSALDLTVGEMWAAGQQVVVLYGGPSQPKLWETKTAGHSTAWLNMNPNGNLEILTNDPAPPMIWETRTGGDITAELRMLESGNLVVERPPAPLILWQSGTTVDPGAWFTMQGDGNLVIYDVGSTAIWSSGTAGNPGATYEMQPDGNLVINDTGGNTIWSSNTPGNPGATLEFQDGNLFILSPPKPKAIWQTGTSGNIGADLVMQDDGNLVLYSPPRPEAIWSTNTQGNPGATLAMQGDGNLVVYGPEVTLPIWASGTAGNPGARLTMQGDGNLVIYDTGGKAIWDSGTVGSPGARLTMQGDGNLVIYDTGGKAIWDSGTAGNPGAWRTMQDDGNLVIYKKTHLPLWASNTDGNPGARFTMQGDGNLVIYDTGGNAIWDSGTVDSPGAWYQMQEDGNLVIYKDARKALWATGTDGNPGATYEMQPDGNLVINDTGGNTIWASNTSGHPGTQLVLEADGNLVIYATILWESGTVGNPGATYALEDGNLVVRDASGTQIWESETGGNPGATLENEEGNIVVRGEIIIPRVAWSTGTQGNPGAWHTMQTDGNLVIYDASDNPIWSSDTQGNPGAILKLPQDGDSNMAILAPPSNFWVYDSNNDEHKDNIRRSEWPDKEFVWDLLPKWSAEVDTVADLKTAGTLKGLWVLQGVATPDPLGITKSIERLAFTAAVPGSLGIYLLGLKEPFAYPATIALDTKVYDYHKTAGLNIVIFDFPEAAPIVETLIGLNLVPTDLPPPAPTPGAPIFLPDTTPPVITINGGTTTVLVEAGEGYTDAGATAEDDEDGNLTASIVTTNPVNDIVINTYSVIYAVSDSAGNSAQALRSVKVVDSTPPELIVPEDITTEGTAELTVLDIGETIATDLFEVTVTNDAPASYSIGTTEITWTATDVNDNNSTQVQQIIIVDTTPPAVTAELIPLELKKYKGKFQIQFSVADLVDANPYIEATLNGEPVTSGQIVELKSNKRYKVKYDDSMLTFKGPEFNLTVTATDLHANTGTVTATHVFLLEEDEEVKEDEDGHQSNEVEDQHDDHDKHESKNKKHHHKSGGSKKD